MNISKSRENLLNWYEGNQSELPWRSTHPEPYHVLLSEFMLQQTTVAAVKPYFENFINRWPSVSDLAKAEDQDVMQAWAGLGYYSRARNLLKAVREIARMGAFPNTYDALIALPGVGDYTAKAILAIAFDQAYVPIDGNVKRILARFHRIDTPIDKPNPELIAASEAWAGKRAGALAQAFMDLGRRVCKPKNPKCEICPLRKNCRAHLSDQTDAYPIRSPKRTKKQWHGYAYIIDTPKGVAFEMREKGLLGEMLGLPSTMGQSADFDPPLSDDWSRAGAVNHVFTHIQLELEICYLKLDHTPKSNRWQYLREEEWAQTASLWKKVLLKYKEVTNG